MPMPNDRHVPVFREDPHTHLPSVCRRDDNRLLGQASRVGCVTRLLACSSLVGPTWHDVETAAPDKHNPPSQTDLPAHPFERERGLPAPTGWPRPS